MAKPPRPRSIQTNSQPPVHEDDSSRGLAIRRTEVSFSGPLPPPNVLSAYEDILPGAADRIFAMVEKQVEHRIEIEKKVVEAGNRHAGQGIWAAVTIEGMFIVASCFLAYQGLGTAAIEVLGGSIISLAGAFGYGTYSRRKEREEKQKRLTQTDEERRTLESDTSE